MQVFRPNKASIEPIIFHLRITRTKLPLILLLTCSRERVTIETESEVQVNRVTHFRLLNVLNDSRTATHGLPQSNPCMVFVPAVLLQQNDGLRSMYQCRQILAYGTLSIFIVFVFFYGVADSKLRMYPSSGMGGPSGTIHSNEPLINIRMFTSIPSLAHCS